MQFAIFFEREGFPSIGFELRHTFKAVACRDVALTNRIIHYGRKNAHFDANGGIANWPSETALAIFPAPKRIIGPFILLDQVNLCASYVVVKRTIDLVFDVDRTRLANLASVGSALLRIGIFLRHLQEGAIEYRNIVLHAKSNVGILIQRTVTSSLSVCGAERDRFVAILVLDSNPAVKIVMRDISAPKDNQARFDLLFINDEAHLLISHCAETVQICAATA
ncbi:hypothetical protein ACR9YC_12780 [Parasphingorhabdus sp. DH2-15]|uniref:hypothetical protein n=1 Tax=Parasphingorhabdus sp. DH2-15 TaxID=3444112 RepID=UPI003F682BC8